MQYHVLGQYLLELDFRLRNKGHVAKVLQVYYLCYTRRHSNLKDERTPCEGHEGNSPGQLPILNCWFSDLISACRLRVATVDMCMLVKRIKRKCKSRNFQAFRCMMTSFETLALHPLIRCNLARMSCHI